MGQCNQLQVTILHSICQEAKLACTHTHTQNCTGHGPVPATAPGQEQQNLRRGLMLLWYSQSHHHYRSRQLAADRAMTALLAAWRLRRMHAVTVRMGHSWRLRMHSLQQIQDLRCSQKVLQGQAKSLHRPVLSISTAVEMRWTVHPYCAVEGVQTLLSNSSSSTRGTQLAKADLRECRHC